MYIILIGWLWLLFFLTIYGLFSRMISVFFPDGFLTDRIDDEGNLKKLKNHLTPDGLLSIQLIKTNTNDFYTCSLLTYLNKMHQN